MKDFKFEIGDSVAHVTNTNIKMVVVEADSNANGNFYECHWLTKKGEKQKEDFYEFELTKYVA